MADNSNAFLRVSDLNDRVSLPGPGGAAYTASLYADGPGAVAELHFFDGDNNELDNAGFESCPVDETHRGITALMNAAGTAPGNIAKIRIVHAGGLGAIYIAQCGSLKDTTNTVTNAANNLYLGYNVSQPAFEAIYEGGYKDVGFTADMDPAMSAAFGSPDDPVASDNAGFWSFMSLVKRNNLLLSPPTVLIGRAEPVSGSTGAKAWGSVQGQRSITIQAYASAVYVKFVTMGSQNVTVSSTNYGAPIPAASSATFALGPGLDVWVQSSGNYSLDVFK